jgi:hypothetical protein
MHIALTGKPSGELHQEPLRFLGSWALFAMPWSVRTV